MSQDRIKELKDTIEGLVRGMPSEGYNEDSFKALKWELKYLEEKEEVKRLKSREVELAKEVLSVWNEDGENGEIQMKTPIAWHRVLRKAEQLIKEFNEREEWIELGKTDLSKKLR